MSKSYYYLEQSQGFDQDQRHCALSKQLVHHRKGRSMIYEQTASTDRDPPVDRPTDRPIE